MKKNKYLNTTIYEILEMNDLLDLQGSHLETNLRRNNIITASDVVGLSSYKLLKIKGITNDSLNILKKALKSVDLYLYGESPNDVKLEDLFLKLDTKNKIVINKVLRILYKQELVTVNDIIDISENILISVYGINKNGVKCINEALALVGKKLSTKY
ncbi:unknown [Clostridium sp. CAG:921]|nr:unknown [Clostridium sp. CAG:921]